MQPTKLIILGGGLAVIEVIELIKDINRCHDKKKYRVLGILDDDDNKIGQTVYGVKVLGKLHEAQEHLVDENVRFIYAIGSINTRLVRQQILEELNIPLSKFETLIHPTCTIAETAKIGCGCILHAYSYIGANSVLEHFVIIAVRTTVGINVTILNFCMLCSHVLILTGVIIKDSAFIGSGSTILDNVILNRCSVVGVGSVVAKNVASSTWVIGNPARIFKREN